MAEAQDEQTQTLAQQWALPEKEEQAAIPIKAAKDETPTKEENPTDGTVAAVVADASDEAPAAAAEEVSEAVEQEESENQDQDDTEEKPEIKIETAPADFRFPTTNQTRHCFTRYIEYHRCIAAKGGAASECNKFAKYYRALCPGEWIDRWNEQRENGTFPGPL